MAIRPPSRTEPGTSPHDSSPNRADRRPVRRLRRISEISVVCAASALFAPVAMAETGLRPLDIALVVGFLILSLGIHEAAHAWVAFRCGDSTARDMGRMTLNPIAHIDPLLTIVIPAVLALIGAPIFGGAKPVPVNYYNLRHPLRDMALVAIAGPASNFLIAILFAIAWKLCIVYGHYSVESPVVLVLLYSMYANIMLTAFNLLPIPPLDGSRVMTWLLPSTIRAGYASLERFGILIVVLLMNVPPVRLAVMQMNRGILYVVDNLTSGIG